MSDGTIASVAQRQQIAELKRAGYVLGETGGSTCADCDKNCGRGWWQRVSYEYDEWECWCRECAYTRLHQYDDFDFDSAAAELDAKSVDIDEIADIADLQGRQC